MKEVILIRYGEIHLKGKNRGYFEKVLINNIKNALQSYNCEVNRIAGRYVVQNYEEIDREIIIQRLQQIFGIYSISPATEIDSNISDIEEYVKTIRLPQNSTFKVEVNRADKLFPFKSYEFASKLGGVILSQNNTLKVDVHSPEHYVYVDIREGGKTYVYYKVIKCAGGMPVGTGGKGLLLLSGGIDSPVAGYQLAHRGMSLSAIHFHSYPYTSESAKQKVLTLAKLLSQYAGDFKVYIVSFTKIQEAIHKYCREEYMITIMRRIMFRIAERLSNKHRFQAIITGESLAQVASQTVESMTSTNEVIKLLPVFRPLIGMDKDQIVEIAKKIGTFETSILPYEDCCTVFLPEHPLIKPVLSKVHDEEKKLNIEELIKEAMENIEVVDTKDI